MTTIRTKSARFQTRKGYLNPYQSRHCESGSYLMLDPKVLPKQCDWEWALRMEIDKFYLLFKHPEYQDGGTFSSALCRAAETLTAMENLCGTCPVKRVTGQPHCENTPWMRVVGAKTKDEYRGACVDMLQTLVAIYEDEYGPYEPAILEDEE